MLLSPLLISYSILVLYSRICPSKFMMENVSKKSHNIAANILRASLWAFIRK
jgi:hypothetical protein